MLKALKYHNQIISRRVHTQTKKIGKSIYLRTVMEWGSARSNGFQTYYIPEDMERYYVEAGNTLEDIANDLGAKKSSLMIQLSPLSIEVKGLTDEAAEELLADLKQVIKGVKGVKAYKQNITGTASVNVQMSGGAGNPQDVFLKSVILKVAKL